MLNRVGVAGRLTHSPELRKTANDVSVVSFSIAVDRDFKDKNTGEKQTDFFNITAWRQTADFVAKYVQKGMLVAIDGKLQTREWTGKDGSKKSGVEIVADSVYLCEKKKVADASQDNSNSTTDAPGKTEPHDQDDDGELPF